MKILTPYDKFEKNREIKNFYCVEKILKIFYCVEKRLKILIALSRD